MTDTGRGARDATDSDAHGHHDWHSAEYVNDWINNDVTHDETRRPKLRRAARSLGFEINDSVRVLDVGGGYGVFAAEILDEWPRAHVVVHDFSIPMTDQARTRLTMFGDRVSFCYGDLREADWFAGAGGPFDAVVSSIAIHNVRDPSIIRRVFTDIAQLVEPGGCFIDVDFVAVPGLLAGGAYGNGRRSAFSSADEPATLVNQLRWLTEAGFDEVDCLWKEGPEACLAAFRKPEAR